MSVLLRFAGVTCRRGGRLLFENLDLQVEPGEALHLVGPNGSGKSSLIRLAAGLLRPESGRVDCAKAALADDQHALDRELPLARALGFWSRIGKDRSQRLGSAMAALGLTPLAGVPVRFLSTGQLKRAALARAAASEAPLWLLDEPTNGLDSASVALLDAMILRHLAGGGGVVAASHVPLAGQWRRLELGA